MLPGCVWLDLAPQSPDHRSRRSGPISLVVRSGVVDHGAVMSAIESRSDPDTRLRDAELKLRVAWLAALAGGPSEREALLDAALHCRLARAAALGRYRVFRPTTRS